MIKSKEQAIETAKEIVSSRFDIGSRPINSRQVNVYEEKAAKDIRHFLVELCGCYLGMDKDSQTIMFEKEDGEPITLIPVKDTVFSRSIVGARIPKREKLYVIAVKVEVYPIYVPVVVLRDAEKENFMMVKSLYGRANAIKVFYKLEAGKQDVIIRRQQNSRRYKRFESEENALFDSKQEQLLMYALTKETFTPDTQRTIETMHRDRDAVKHKVEQRLRYISAISPSCEGRIPVDAEVFAAKLDEKFYKMDRPKQQIKDLFTSIERADKKGCNVLFVGAPGVGKTSLMMAIVEAMNLPFENIPMNGLSCPFEIEGLDPGYDSADAGAIVKAFAAHGTSQIVLCLDEFDKVNRHSKEGDPMNVFLRVFLGEHYDRFLQCTVKTDNTIFIATANRVDDIPEAIMNRFNAVIYLDDYTCEDKLEIA